uniref:SCP domain-containing protein n=1 Tax=Mesocestoides corti TaxID=53468 RepID=A0A5K3F6H3_MESCO
MSKTLICLLALAWCVATNSVNDGGNTGLSEDDRKAILTAHSSIRKSVNPTASNMLMLNYSVELEQQAADFLKDCPLGNDSPAGAETNAELGKTTYIDGSNAMTFAQIIAEFGKEKDAYTYENNACAKDKTCSNYTQVVWAESNEVGCARQVCQTQTSSPGNPDSPPVQGETGGNGRQTDAETTTQVACFYKPAGNAQNTLPYETGEICSKCPTNFKCEENQCVNSAPAMLSAVAVLISALLTTQCFA